MFETTLTLTLTLAKACREPLGKGGGGNGTLGEDCAGKRQLGVCGTDSDYNASFQFPPLFFSDCFRFRLLLLHEVRYRVATGRSLGGQLRYGNQSNQSFPPFRTFRILGLPPSPERIRARYEGRETNQGSNETMVSWERGWRMSHWSSVRKRVTCVRGNVDTLSAEITISLSHIV